MQKYSIWFKYTFKEMLIIGIAGGTGSGKTTVVRKIIESLPAGEVVLLPQDSYYKDSSHVPVEERQNINFDHPDAFEWSLLSKHVMTLKEGKSIEQPTYSYLTCTRQLQVASVTTPAIKDGSVTGSKIADDAISGEKIKKGTIPADKMAAPGVIYLEPTTVLPHAMLSNYKLNIIRIGNIGTHVNAVMPVQQLPGTPVRIFIEHTFSENAVVDIRLSNAGVVAGNINISNTVRGMYAEIFVYDGRVFYWVSSDGNYQRG